MNLIIRILLILILIDFGVGFYLLSQEHPLGNKIVGIGVLVFAFVLLPLFLYHRYKGKKLKDYTLNKEKINKIIDNLNS